MKATLTFNLSDPDDSRDYYLINKSSDMAMFIWQLSHNTKKELEYEIEAKKKMSSYETLDMLFEKIHELLNEHDVNINKLG
jgi:hypothetical protein